jgi:hypothetical protein
VRVQLPLPQRRINIKSNVSVFQTEEIGAVPIYGSEGTPPELGVTMERHHQRNTGGTMSDENDENVNRLLQEIAGLESEISQLKSFLTLERQRSLMLQEELASLRTLGTDFQ